MMIHFQIVVETVLDWRPRSELRLRPDPQDGRRQNVRARMPQSVDFGHLLSRFW